MRGGASIFDSMSCDDIIMAFFPCIYFCENNQLYFTGEHHNLKGLDGMRKSEIILKRARDREQLYELCLMLFAVCDQRKLRLIVENPYAISHFLVNNFPYKASVVDMDRTLRGDLYRKPTQYWFVNCKPTHGLTLESPKEHKTIGKSKSGVKAGICSEVRSMISTDYARNFICDFIIGKEQVGSQLNIFPL